MDPIDPIEVIPLLVCLIVFPRGETIVEPWSEATGCPMPSGPSALGAFRYFSFETAALLMFLAMKFLGFSCLEKAGLVAAGV